MSDRTTATQKRAGTDRTGDRNGKSMLEKTVAYAITFSRIGTKRKVDTELIKTDAETDRISVSKRILQCDEIQEIRALDRQLKIFIGRRSVDYPLKPGIHLIPADLVEEVDEEVERVRPKREKLVKQLAERVDELREKDREALGSLFKESDYPTKEQVLEEYSLQTRYLALDLPGNLASVSKAVFDRERVRVQQELQDAAEAVRQVQRLQLMQLVQGLLDRLVPGEGKKKIIKTGGALDKCAEFLGRYEKLNVANDQELAKIVTQARDILSGVDCDALRSNDAAIEAVKEGMGEVKKALEPLVQDAPKRKFRTSVE